MAASLACAMRQRPAQLPYQELEWILYLVTALLDEPPMVSWMMSLSVTAGERLVAA